MDMDIVEALRNPLLVADERFGVAKQAADELERKDAEIERLRNHVASAEGAMQEMIQVAANADAEINRLRATLSTLLLLAGQHQRMYGLSPELRKAVEAARRLTPPVDGGPS